MGDDEKELRDAVKTARSTFYKNKGQRKKQSRKDVRKNKRAEKKVKQHQFMLKKHNKTSDVATVPNIQEPLKRKKKKKRKAKSLEENDEESLYSKSAYEAANKRDEKIIATLGKKLKLTSNSSRLKPFNDDGLDYILEVCEPFTEENNPDLSDEEYLASKKLKSLRKKGGKETDVLHHVEEIVKDRLLFEDGTDMNFDDPDTIEDELILAQGDVSDSDDSFSDNEDILEESLSDDADDEDDQPDEHQLEINNDDLSENKSSGKYVPPALRRSQQSEEEKELEKQERIKKLLKGLLNRISSSTLNFITKEVEEIYSQNSRNMVNEVLFALVYEALVTESAMPERLIMEHSVIIAALQNLTRSEIGSYTLQMLVEKFDNLHQDGSKSYGVGKQCYNILQILSYFYILKIVDCVLIYNIMQRLVKCFKEQDIELILLLLKICGSEIRRDDPGCLKEVILEIQAKSVSSELLDQSRVRFMLELINALKNNNMRKILNHDPSILEEGRKLLKILQRGREYSSAVQLKVTLEDLLNAKEKGKWWIVGSAWTGRGPAAPDKMMKDAGVLSKDKTRLLEVARKQRMNTNLRKDIFCILMTSEDYLNAFERLLKLNLKEKQAREIIHVLLDCCLQEKEYNPYYAHLADRFSEYSHSNQVTLQYSFWDRFKTLPSLSKHSISNMTLLLAHLISSKSLSLAVLKVLNFGVLDKPSIKFLISLFKILLLRYPETVSKAAFKRIANNEKLSVLREGIKIFLKHFLLPTTSSKDESALHMQNEKLKELVETAESALDGREYVPL